MCKKKQKKSSNKLFICIENDKKSTALAWHYYCWLLQTNGSPLINGSMPIFQKSNSIKLI